MINFDFIHTPIQPGLSVIEASAGTGKTFAISHLVPRLLLEGTIQSVSECLLVTFTNDAAGELAERVRRVLTQLAAPAGANEAKENPGVHAIRCQFPHESLQTTINKALLEVDRLNVCTIHSYCMQVLQTEGTLCGLPVIPELCTDVDEILNQLVRDYWEIHVASDLAMTSLKVSGGWHISDDIQFCHDALPYPEAEFIPAVPDIKHTIAQCEALFSTRDECDTLGLRSLFLEIPKRKKDTPSTQVFESHFRKLMQAKFSLCTGCSDCAQLHCTGKKLV
ncbi:MAG: UvrD-helicase domain-containing protein [Verrucomicrobia bacterium]|nr:UvrD-helicase domain-containing protein [Verrucomicrobiota bacterium]